MPTISDLRQRQSLPLPAKVRMTETRIREWYEHFDGNVYVSFSGGKDSTVLAHLVRGLYPDVPLVFSNTGLEYPEIQAFAREMGAEFVRPKMMFSEVISTFGYPIISKEVASAIYYARRIKNGNGQELTVAKKRMEMNGERPRNVGGGGLKRRQLAGVGEDVEKSMFNKEKWLPLCRDADFKISHYCCNVMKKNPITAYQKKAHRKPFIGTLTEESRLREQVWLRNGCNAFNATKKTSQPLSFWTEQDILQYIHQNGLKIASVYGEIVSVDANGFEYVPIPGVDCKLKCSGCQRTGCVFCAFGAHLDKGETRFQRLAKTHPKQYDYCMKGGQWVENPEFDPTAPEYDDGWKNWNPRKIWVPSKEGLGMKYVFDRCNEIYGKDFLRYE